MIDQDRSVPIRTYEALEPAHMNGAAAPEQPRRTGDARGGMIAGRTPWLDLPEPFDNLEIRCWLDYPKWLADLWTAPENETQEEAGARFMLACQHTFLDHREACAHADDPQRCRAEHASWEDDDGALPPPSSSDFWERIPTPLYKAIVERFSEAMAPNPQNRASRRFKRKRSRVR